MAEQTSLKLRHIFALDCSETKAFFFFQFSLHFSGRALLDLMQRCDDTPPSPGQRVLCRHPFDEAKRAYVCPSHVETLYHVYWKNGKVHRKP